MPIIDQIFDALDIKIVTSKINFLCFQCTQTCGTGQQTRSLICLSHPNGIEVDKSECSHLREPNDHKIQPCNREPCPSWAYGEQTPVNYLRKLISKCLYFQVPLFIVVKQYHASPQFQRFIFLVLCNFIL